MTNNEHNEQDADNQNKNAAVKPEPETLHKTDPQDNMEGPISSLMHKTGESFDTDETKEEADEKKDEGK
jgi:hypothetical protein